MKFFQELFYDEENYLDYDDEFDDDGKYFIEYKGQKFNEKMFVENNYSENVDEKSNENFQFENSKENKDEMYDDKLVEVEVEYFDYVSEEVEVEFSVNVS